MNAKKPTDKPFRRDGTGPLIECGMPGTFGRAVAEKLATTGLTEDEYIALLKTKNPMKRKPLNEYIEYYRQWYKIDKVNGRYSEKKEFSKVTNMESQSIHYLPTEEDFITASRLAPLGERVSIDAILDQIEINVTKEGHSLKPNWRMITEENIKTWIKK